MTEDRRAALVERMIETFVTSGGMELSDGNRLAKWPPLVDGMSAALDLALEEAAKECVEQAKAHAEKRDTYPEVSEDWIAYNSRCFAANCCADAIRALKSKP